ncbi:platelet-activating factor receptor isoform X2 [Cinclus cinclus]|uniref:platelet-activating factor receptor isoform X2 n=1 Tax=Cinclus cinclus TaxID=127875 RepID=UPI002E152E43
MPIDTMMSGKDKGGVEGSADPYISCHIDSEFRYNLFTVFYSIIFILGFVANCYVLWIFSRIYPSKKLNEIKIFMVNLTVADLLFLVTMPMWIVYYHHHGDWIMPEFLCNVAGCLFFVNTYSSVAFLMVITYNRYQAVTNPIKAAQLTTQRRGWNIVIIRTLFSKSEHPRKSTHIKQRALWMVCTVLAVFIISFVPHHIVHLPWTLTVLEQWKKEDCQLRQQLNDAHQVTLCLLSTNCVLDPIIYCFLTKKFQKHLSENLKSMKGSRKCSRQTTDTVIEGMIQQEDAIRIC